MNKCSDIKDLQLAITNMDNLSQDGSDQIEAIARLAVVALDTAEPQKHLDDVRTALTIIGYIASSTMNSINCEAEQMGCNYIDEEARRKMFARPEASHG